MKLKLKRVFAFSAVVMALAVFSVNNANSEIRRCLNNNDKECKIYKGKKLKKEGTGGAIVISGILKGIVE